MDSHSLLQYGFKDWYKLVDVMLGKAVLPSTSGVYVLRLKHHFGRLRGESDILYIGSTNDIQHRIIENFLKGKGGETTQRIHDYLFSKGYLESVEISWVIRDDYEDLEKKLLKEYEDQHHELPPWNRAL